MFKSRNWFALITGILFVLAALLAVFNPILNMGLLGCIFSVSVLVDGCIGIYDYFITEKGKRSCWQLLLAVITVLIGLSLVGDTLIEQAYMVPVLLSVWLMAIGISRVVFAFREKKLLEKKEVNHLLLSGVLSVILGLLAFLHPMVTGIFVVYWVAAGLFVFGILRIVEFFTVKKSA